MQRGFPCPLSQRRAEIPGGDGCLVDQQPHTVGVIGWARALTGGKPLVLKRELVRELVSQQPFVKPSSDETTERMRVVQVRERSARITRGPGLAKVSVFATLLKHA